MERDDSRTKGQTRCDDQTTPTSMESRSLARDGTDPVTGLPDVWESYLVRVSDPANSGQFREDLSPKLTPLEHFGIDARDDGVYEQLMSLPQFNCRTMSEYQILLMLAVYKAHKMYVAAEHLTSGLYTMNYEDYEVGSAHRVALDQDIDEYIFREIFKTTFKQSPDELALVVQGIVLKNRIPSDAVQFWCKGAAKTVQQMYALPTVPWKDCDTVAIYRQARMAVLSSAEGMRQQVIPGAVVKPLNSKLSGSCPPMTSFLPTRCIGRLDVGRTESVAMPPTIQPSSSSSSFSRCSRNVTSHDTTSCKSS